MKATKQIDIYLTGKRNVRVIDVVQYDTGIQLAFAVKDFTIPSSANATLYVQKPSGKFVYQEKGITVSGNTITVDLHNQAITEHGKVPYQVSITSGSDVITTFTGLMMVEKSLKDAGATESKTVIRAFDEAVSDHVAEFQTKAEQIVAACIATIPDDYSTMEAKVNELANAVKGYLSGAVVFADDVSPVEHSPVVRVHGKNLIPYPYKLETATDGGITFTARADGGIALSGTPDGTFAGMTLYSGKPLAKKGYVALSLLGEFAGVYVRIDIKDNDGNVLYAGGAKSNDSTFNLDNFPTATQWDIFVRNIDGAKAVSGIAYPQIEIGKTATAYEPYIDPSTVTVSRHGKNLAYGGTSQTYTNKGLTITRVEDSSKFVLNGTVTGTFSYVPTKRITLTPGTYTVSVYGLNKVGSNLDRCFVYDSVNSKVLVNSIMTDKPQSFTIDSCVQVWIEVVFAEGTTYSNARIKLQMECGSEATEYEECKEVATFVPAADGTVSGVTSISPNMTILTDTDGVMVECEYNVDLNKFINALRAGASNIRIADVELPASAWVGTANIYSQVVDIAGTTEYSQVNLNPSVEQMAIFYEKDLTFVTENEDGVITVYAIGQKPANDYVIQATIKEVSA